MLFFVSLQLRKGDTFQTRGAMRTVEFKVMAIATATEDEAEYCYVNEDTEILCEEGETLKVSVCVFYGTVRRVCVCACLCVCAYDYYFHGRCVSCVMWCVRCGCFFVVAVVLVVLAQYDNMII